MAVAMAACWVYSMDVKSVALMVDCLVERWAFALVALSEKPMVGHWGASWVDSLAGRWVADWAVLMAARMAATKVASWAQRSLWVAL